MTDNVRWQPDGDRQSMDEEALESGSMPGPAVSERSPWSAPTLRSGGHLESAVSVEFGLAGSTADPFSADFDPSNATPIRPTSIGADLDTVDPSAAWGEHGGAADDEVTGFDHAEEPALVDAMPGAGAASSMAVVAASSVSRRPRSRSLAAVLIVAALIGAGVVAGAIRRNHQPTTETRSETGRLPSAADELWSRPLGDRLVPNSFASVGDTFLYLDNADLSSPRSAPLVLSAVEGRAGAEMWTTTLADGEEADIVTATESTVVLIITGATNRLVGYSVSTGDQLWETTRTDDRYAQEFLRTGLIAEFGGFDPFDLVLRDADSGELLGSTDGEFVGSDLSGTVLLRRDDELLELDVRPSVVARLAEGQVIEPTVIATIDGDVGQSVFPISGRALRIDDDFTFSELLLGADSVGDQSGSTTRDLEVVDARPSDMVERDGVLPSAPIGDDSFVALAVARDRCIVIALQSLDEFFGCRLIRNSVQIEWSATGLELSQLFVSERGVLVEAFVAGGEDDVRGDVAGSGGQEGVASRQLIDAVTGDILVSHRSRRAVSSSVAAADGVVVPIAGGSGDDPSAEWSGFDLDGSELWTLRDGLEPIAVGDEVVFTVESLEGEMTLRGHGER